MLVPEETSDFEFMKDWGTETAIRDLGLALAFARALRFLTESDHGKVHLLGWSRGGIIGYSYLGHESQKPHFLRHVKGFIPVDIWMKTDEESLRTAACDLVPVFKEFLDNGFYVQFGGWFINQLGKLAVTDPNGTSPYYPDLTNRQAALSIGASPSPGPSPWYHLVGAQFDDGVPTNLLYTGEDLYFDFLQNAGFYQPMKIFLGGIRIVV